MIGLSARWQTSGHVVSDQTVGNVLQRHGVPPAPERKRTTTWPAFIRTHLALLAGTDFFTAEVLTLRGLVTYYVLFFIHLESRRVDIAGITVHPDEPWMKQMARNVTMEGCGILRDCRYLLHDRDTKYTQSFRAIIASGRVEPLALPARSPNLNAYAERWVRSVKEECLSKVILFGERSLRRALNEYVEHYHAERNHQGKGNVLLFPRDTVIRRDSGLFNAASDWVGSCAITIKRRRDRTPKVQSETLIPRAAIGRSRKPQKTALCYPLSQLWRSSKLDRPVNYRFFRRSNFLTIRDRHRDARQSLPLWRVSVATDAKQRRRRPALSPTLDKIMVLGDGA